MEPVTVTAHDPITGETQTQELRRDGYVLIVGELMILDSEVGHGTGTIVLTLKRKCTKCRGEKQVANSDDQEPWSAWAELPPGSDLAVRLGLVQPIPCPTCKGTGTQ